jgi:uncharacterized membrane protein
MSNITDFLHSDNQEDRSGVSRAVGTIGIWFLHLCAIAFLLYSGAHGINAALQFAGSSTPAKVAQIVGIIVIESVLFGIYLAFLNGKITGPAQTIAAGITYLIGFTLACLGIIADSQLNSGVAMSSEILLYLRWGLPIAPAVMALGALLIHVLSPHNMRDRRRAEQERDLEETSFSTHLIIEQARAEEILAKQALQAMSRKAVVNELENIYTSAEFREAIKRTAVEKAPELFADAGILVDRLALPEDLESSDNGSKLPDFLSKRG